MKMTKALAVIAASAVAATTLATVASAADYNGYIQFQTTQYSFRNHWTEASYGLNTEYFDDYIAWGNNDESYWPQYEDYFDYDIAGYVLPATYNDAVITGDGTYTVEAKDLDWGVTGDSAFNLLLVNTDIPIDSGAVITKASIIVDGTVTATVDNPLVNPDDKEYVSILLANIWNTDLTNSYDGAFPTESLAIEFTVEGLGGADTTVDAPATGDVDASTDSSKGSPDTGIEDVAVIGGLAVLAGAAIAFTRKRK